MSDGGEGDLGFNPHADNLQRSWSQQMFGYSYEEMVENARMLAAQNFRVPMRRIAVHAGDMKTEEITRYRRHEGDPVRPTRYSLYVTCYLIPEKEMPSVG